MNDQLLISPESLHIKIPAKGYRGNSLSPIGSYKSLSPIGSYKSISPISNFTNFWSSLKGFRSKYIWMTDVFEQISESIPKDKLTVDVMRYIELCLEKFTDNYLSQIQVTGFEKENFSREMLFNWFGFEAETIEDDADVGELCDILQDCYDLNNDELADDPTNVTNLLITICSNLIIKFLIVSLNNMLKTISNPEELTLFFVIYTAEYDARFSIFRLEEYIQPGVIPEFTSNDGLTVGTLQLILPDFIKKSYDDHPSLEPGCIELLAGVSNIIVINDKSDQIVLDKLPYLIDTNSSLDMTIFLNLHRYILYLIFEEIQKILLTKNNTQWTNAIVLDAINTSAKRYRKEIS